MNNTKKKRKNEKLTVLLIPNSGAKAKRLSLSHRQIKGALMGIVFMSVLLVLAGLTIYQGRHTLSEAMRIKAQHEEQKRLVTELNNKLLEMEKQRERIEKQQEQIRKLVGSPTLSSINPATNPSRGNMGGVSRTERPDDLQTISKEISSLQFLLNEREKETLTLLNLATNNINKLRSIPNHWPLGGEITSTFGWRGSPFSRSRSSREFHDGIDIAAPYGSEVHAAADGVVIEAGWVAGWGRIIKIRHNGGLVSVYAHNSRILVKPGDSVTKGTVIAKVGSSGRSTGPHLHFTIEKDGKAVDPMIYLP
ncbi:MAG: M23 family metallopeptidase [Bacillota bacterium]